MLSFVGCSDDDNIQGTDPVPPTPPTPTQDFQFETLELTQGSLKVKITPTDEKITYYFGVLEKAKFDEYATSEELQTEVNESISDMAAANNIPLEQFLMEALLSGVQEWRFSTLAPETDYVFNAYGLSTELKNLTTVNSFAFKPPTVAPIDVNFTISASEVTPTSFTLNVEPDRTDCNYYYYDILLPTAYRDYCNSDPANVPAFVESYLQGLKATDQFAPYSMPEFVNAITKNGKTSDVESFKNLLPEGTYYAFAVCVANDGTCISEATVEAIKTSETPKNIYKVTSDEVTDITYLAVISAEQSETFAVMMELQEYFTDAKDDSEIIQMLCDAHKQNISKYLYADSANVNFNDLIPNDNYYLLIFACNPDGTPKLGDKVNLMKKEIKIEAAKMSQAQYELSVSGVTKTSAKVVVKDNSDFRNETFLLNYVTKAEYDAMADKTAGIQAYTDKFVDAKLKAWNESHSGEMTRKEFLSRSLMNGREHLYKTFEMNDLNPSTAYYAYVIGLKADGTYTTAPFMKEFTTVADQVSLASLDFSVMSYGYVDKHEDMYMVWVYASNSKNHYF